MGTALTAPKSSNPTRLSNTQGGSTIPCIKVKSLLAEEKQKNGFKEEIFLAVVTVYV
jgi:hypothetical protein